MNPRKYYHFKNSGDKDLKARAPVLIESHRFSVFMSSQYTHSGVSSFHWYYLDSRITFGIIFKTILELSFSEEIKCNQFILAFLIFSSSRSKCILLFNLDYVLLESYHVQILFQLTV